MPSPLHVRFVAAPSGAWHVEQMRAICGDALPFAAGLTVHESFDSPLPRDHDWVLRGTTSNTRYTTRMEVENLSARQQGLGRPEAKCAALIPIRKSEAWWSMAQDERRAIFEERSRHIAIGLDYLPAVARRLHHCRELAEPFDFLTWFEFAPEHQPAFDDMLARLRATEEWRFVEREVDIRLKRA